jgi:UrcA family protein
MSKNIHSAQVLSAVLAAIVCAIFSSAALGEDNVVNREVKIQGDQIVTVTVGHARLGTAPAESLQLSRNVRFTDLDLTTQVGATELQNRILDTASSICQKLMNASPPGSVHEALQEKRVCVDDAFDGAMIKARQAISSARASAKEAKRLS